MISPKLILVGAGPGDEELFTLKGIKALENADVVLYDALANDELLKYCKVEAKMIFVGKRAGEHSSQQAEINQLIVDHALKYGTVVRLKGGDPFVFGRGYEEISFAKRHGLDVEIVPGVTSAIAAPSSQHIPLTMRGVNESFWVITGTTKENELSKDMHLAAQSSATVVILMGMKKLSKIVELFKTYRGEEEPIAIVMNGTLETEKLGIGNLSNIQKIVHDQQLASPSIIVIGRVVKHGKYTVKKVINHI